MSDDLVGNANIVKVELSPFSEADNPILSVYSHDGSIDIEIKEDDELLARMAGESKKYFYYRKEGTAIELLNDAGELEW